MKCQQQSKIAFFVSFPFENLPNSVGPNGPTSLSQIPFPLLASLNGVALFGESHDVTLLSTDITDADCRVIWRDYHASVRLVLVAPV